MNKLIMVFILLVGFTVLAAPKGWSPLTDQTRKTCDLESHCFLNQKKAKLKFQIFFEVHKKNKMFWLKKVTISDVASKQTKSYDKLDNFQGLFPGEKQNIYALDINNDGYLDIALEASRSWKEGYYYFYWLYHPKKQEFILTKDQLPELSKSVQGKIRSAVNNNEFKVTKKYTLRKI